MEQLLKSETRAKDIKAASSGEICTVCEVVKNLVRNPQLKVKPTPVQQSLLRKNAGNIRRLIDRSVPIKKKKEILQKGEGIIIPLIAALAGPILNKLLK